MNKDIRIIEERDAYRFKPNNSIEKDVLDKVRDTIDNQEFAGNFYSSSWEGSGDGYLYELDAYDKHLVRSQPVKPNQKFYRYFTRRSALTGITRLIKINTENGLLYFLKPDSDDNIEFETKGIPVRYLNLVKKEDEFFAVGGELKSYLSTHSEMFNDNAKTISKKDVVDFIALSSDSDKKYWVKDVDTGYSYFIYQGKLRANDSAGGIFKTTILNNDRLKDGHQFKIREDDLYDWEKEEDPSIKKTGWEAIKQKFGDVFFIEQDGKNEIYANEVKLTKPTYNWDGRPSPYNTIVDFSEAKDIFLKSLTPEEKDSINIEYDYKDVHELFGLMSYKKIIVRKKDDFLNELDKMDFDDKSFYPDGGQLSGKNTEDAEIFSPSYYIITYGFQDDDGEYRIGKTKPIWAKTRQELDDAIFEIIDQFESYEGIPMNIISEEKFPPNKTYSEGGKVLWQNVEVGDNALVKQENKMGVVTVTYGRRFHLRFPDGSEKTYSAEELEFIPNDDFAMGGALDDLVGRNVTMYSMGVPEPTHYTISRVEMSPPYFAIKSLKLYHKNGMFEFEDVLEGSDINKFIKGEQVDLRDSSGDYYAIQLTEKMQSKMKTGGKIQGGVREDMLFDKNGERRVDKEALEYIENTVEMLPQTKFMYTNEKGEYKPARKKLHEQIIAHFHEDKPCVNKRPAVAILTGGAPASGKTTFIKKYVDLDPDKVYHIDADEVRAMLPEYKGYNATQTHLETADIVNRLISDIGEPCDHDLIYDGTMNKATKYEKIVDKLHKLGYKVFVVYISIPEQISKERVVARYKKAGRYVPMKVIEEVYDNGLTAFEKVAREMADGYIRIDGMNGEVIEKGGMEIPKNIEYAQGGEIDSNYLKNADSLVRSAERYAEHSTGNKVMKGRGMARTSKKDGKMKYTEVIVFFQNGEHIIYEEEEFPQFFMRDGGELGNQDYYDGFQMQVVTKKGNPDKEVQKQNAMFKYRKGGNI
jgi:predicted ABC-type ATPase